jgi:glycine/D-amino acid oxidase-like deaminating enzyme
MMDNANVRWRVSLWVAATPSGPDLPRLVGTVEADVIVIGGGFTGLSTALHLREAGVDVTIIEAMETGWGASGRNNGQVIPTLSRPDPDDIVTKYGAAGERFVALLRQRIDLVRYRAALSDSGRAGTNWVAAAGAFARAHQDRRTAGAPMVEIRRAGRIALARPDAPDARVRRLVRR